MNVELYNALTTLYDALHQAVTSQEEDQRVRVEEKVNALTIYIQQHTTDLSRNLADHQSQTKLYKEITTDIERLQSASGKVLLKEIQFLFFRVHLLKLEELAKSPQQLVLFLNEREAGVITEEDLRSSPLKVLDAFDKIREFSTGPQELQSEFDKTLSKMVVSSLNLESKTAEEVAALFKTKQIDERALACFVNAKEIALKSLDFPIESLNALAPYLNHVDCRDIEFKEEDQAQTFIKKCAKAYKIFINSDKIVRIEKLPKTLRELHCVGCRSLEVVCCPNFTSLETLSLQSLTALKMIQCYNCTALKTLNLEGVTTLKIIECYNSTALKTLNLEGLTFLEQISCYGCTSLTTLSLQGLTSLQRLYCSSCTSLTTLMLQNLTRLENLYCTDCTSLTTLTLQNLTFLEKLYSSRCTSLTTLSLQSLTGLKEIYCIDCTSLTTLSFQALTTLQKLYCRKCTSLTLLSLFGLTALNQLDCRDCTSLTILSFLGLEALTEIKCTNCQNLTSLGDSLPNTLELLHCEDCPSLAQLPQVPPTATVYSGNGPFGKLNRFEVNPKDVQEKPLELLLQLGEILLQNKPFPNIVYIDPLTEREAAGIDAGGLRRQFIYDLSQRLFKRPSDFPFIEKLQTAEGNFPVVDIRDNKQVAALRTLARLIAFALTSKALITGPILSQNFYHAALFLAKDPELLDTFKIPLTDEQKKELYLLAEYGYQTNTSLSKEEKSFLVIGDSIAIVAHELKAVLRASLKDLTLDQFIAKVQGITVNAETLLGTTPQGTPRISFDMERAPQIQGFVETFIRKFDTTDTLKEFVKFIIGSRSLGIEEQIKVQIALNASINYFPIAHTCFQSIEFPFYQTYEAFEEKLMGALNEAKNSFGLQ